MRKFESSGWKATVACFVAGCIAPAVATAIDPGIPRAGVVAGVIVGGFAIGAMTVPRGPER